MSRATLRDDFVRPLPDENPLQWSERNWAITVAYINDDVATLRSVAATFGLSAPRVREIIEGAYLRCWRQAPDLVIPRSSRWWDED